MSQTPVSSYTAWIRLRYPGGIWESGNEIMLHKNKGAQFVTSWAMVSPSIKVLVIGALYFFRLLIMRE